MQQTLQQATTKPAGPNDDGGTIIKQKHKNNNKCAVLCVSSGV